MKIPTKTIQWYPRVTSPCDELWSTKTRNGRLQRETHPIYLRHTTQRPHTTTPLYPYINQRIPATLRQIRYIADSTRTDIYFVTNSPSFPAKKPTKHHNNAGKRLIRYLKYTSTYKILSKAENANFAHQKMAMHTTNPKNPWNPSQTPNSQQILKTASSYQSY